MTQSIGLDSFLIGGNAAGSISKQLATVAALVVGNVAGLSTGNGSLDLLQIVTLSGVGIHTGVGLVTVVTLSGLGAIGGAGSVVVGDVVGEAVLLLGVGSLTGVGLFTLVALCGLSTISGAGSIVVELIFGEAVLAGQISAATVAGLVCILVDVTQSGAFIGNSLGLVATAAHGGLGAVLQAGSVAVGQELAHVVTQSGANSGAGIGLVTLVALSGLGAVFGTGSIVVEGIAGEAVLALGSAGSGNSVNSQTGNELFVVLVEGQQLEQLGLEGAFSGNLSGEGQNDGAFAKDGGQVIVTGPHHGALGPVSSGPTQVGLQSAGNGSSAGHILQTSGEAQLKLQSGDALTHSVNGVVNGIANSNLSCGSLHGHIHHGTHNSRLGLGGGGLLCAANGNLTDGQLRGELFVVLVEGQQLEQLGLEGAFGGNLSGEGQNDGAFAKDGGQVIVAGPHHGTLSPVSSGPTQVGLQGGGNSSSACHIFQTSGESQLELQSGNAFTGSIHGVVDDIAHISSRSGGCDRDSHRRTFCVNSRNDRQNHCQDHEQC